MATLIVCLDRLTGLRDHYYESIIIHYYESMLYMLYDSAVSSALYKHFQTPIYTTLNWIMLYVFNIYEQPQLI